MWRSLRVLLTKEFLQIRRDAVILRMLLVMPLLQLLVLANAATFEIRASDLWVVDQDRTPAARALVDRFTATRRFSVAGYSIDNRAGEEAMLRGSANAILVIPPAFERDVVRDRAATLQLVLNAENGSQAGVIQAYASEIIARYAAELGGMLLTLRRAVGAGSERAPVRGQPAIEARTRARYNTSLDYQRFMVPGLLVHLITLIGTLMTALNIVREKEAGTLDQLNVTPIRPAVFIAAKLLPLWIIGLLEFAGGLVLARLVFSVPIEGSVLLLLVGAAIYLLAALGLGLWVSTVSDTQQQALFVTFSLLMIYLLMSGLFTPVRAMPGWVQGVAQLNPMMHFISMVRAVMLKGADLSDVWRQLLALALLGSAMLGLAVVQYRKREA
jgi:ABC-2 type transport system permease protein